MSLIAYFRDESQPPPEPEEFPAPVMPEPREATLREALDEIEHTEEIREFRAQWLKMRKARLGFLGLPAAKPLMVDSDDPSYDASWPLAK